MTTTLKRIADLKDAGEDFEWYPTTDEIINKVANDARTAGDRHYRYHQTVRLLDIGAGDGRVLEGIAEAGSCDSVDFELFAIEKAMSHIANMPKRIVVIGTDLHENTLVDKEMDAIFCNPPYSEYLHWMKRILNECSANRVYMVIPRRWRQDMELAEMLERFEIKERSLGDFDFETADRKARCKVEVVRFDMPEGSAAFDRAIEQLMPEMAKWDDRIEAAVDAQKAEQATFKELVASSDDTIEALVMAYDSELAKMYDSHRDIAKIDPVLLKQLGVEKKNLLEGLRDKIKGLKSKYWKTLFEHIDGVTKRLATKQRKSFLESLAKKVVIDFTAQNARSLLIWICKWASEHFDDQLVDLYRAMARRSNVEAYKSNAKVFTDKNWRYLREEASHYKLNFRIVLDCMGGCRGGYDWEYPSGLSNRSHEFLGDLITVANNLGFGCSASTMDHQWKAGKTVKIDLDNGEPLCDVRAFKNGNIHVRIAKPVILSINVQAGKLLGWLHSPDEAMEELETDDAKAVAEAFAKTHKIEPSNLLRIGSAA